MKLKMALMIPLLMALTLCSKEESPFKSKGIITGPDYRKCACWGTKCGCCGHYIIQIDSATHVFVELPKEPYLDLGKTKFPVNISLDWHKDPDSCSLSWGYIIIDRFKLN